MVNAVGTSNINSVQMFSAMNAFKDLSAKPEAKAPEIPDGVDIDDNTLLKNQDVNEIKMFAKIAGEENVSEDDIMYGLAYGRSVIADYSA